MKWSPSVWAPFAGQVALLVGEQRMGMQRHADGWWHAGHRLGHGDDYAFEVDGEGPFPDPRSAWQPDGVLGASRVLDHSLHQWGDAGWQPAPWNEAVVYELHVGTFTPDGTFDAAIDRLDAVRELGVTHVELMPVASFGGRYGWGYDGAALYAPHEPYGGPAGLKRLVDACHARSLGVILDVVYNHLGPVGNFLARFGPYFADWYRTPWGDAVNFDGPYSDEVRRFFIDNAGMWLRDYHFDGLRIDAVHAIIDTSAVHFLEQLRAAVDETGTVSGQPPVLVIESDRNDPRPVMAPERGGYGMDGVWNEDFHHALHTALSGERHGYYEDFEGVSDVATALRRGFVHDGRYSSYRRRRHGRKADIPPGRLLGFLQNHDQVGNRARGDRIGHLAGVERQRVGAALMLLSPFVPLMFQGEEWAASSPFPYFTDFDDPELAAAVREGRRREFARFGWDADDVPDPQAEATFRSARLDWDERVLDVHARMLDWYRRLLALRREMTRKGAFRDWPEVAGDPGSGCLLVDHGPCVLACNLGDGAREVTLPDDRDLSLRESCGDVERIGSAVRLGPWAVAVFVQTSEEASDADET